MADDLKQQGAALLRLCREHSPRLSQRGLAVLSGVNKNAVSRIVNGKRAMSADEKYRFTQVLGLTVAGLEQSLASDGLVPPPNAMDYGTVNPFNLDQPLHVLPVDEALVLPVDEALAQLQRAVSQATKEAIGEWTRQQQLVKRQTEREHLEDMLRRILSRASTSAPADWEFRYTPAGAPYCHIGRAEEIVRVAIELVNNISNNAPTAEEREQDHDAILMTWRGERDPIGAIRDVHLRTQWVSAVRGAITKGWNFKHYIKLFGHQDDQEKALRCVLNALTFTGPSERYQLHVLSAPDSDPTLSAQSATDYLLVPNQGVVVIHDATEADYYPYRSRDEKSMENYDQLYATVTRVTGKSEDKNERETPRKSERLCRLYPQLSDERRAAIVHLEGACAHRILCMNGLPQYLVPEEVHKSRYEVLTEIIRERGGKSTQAYLTFARETLSARRQRAQLLEEDLMEGRHRHRDICPERAIVRLVKYGRTSHNDADDSLHHIAARLGAQNFPVLTLEQRRACLSALVNRLKVFDQYELVLLPDSEADIFGTYCLIRDGIGVLLQFWKRQRNVDDNEDVGPRVYTAMHINNPTMIRAFSENPLLQPYDRDLDPTNKARVIKFLEEHIAILNRRIAI